MCKTNAELWRKIDFEAKHLPLAASNDSFEFRVKMVREQQKFSNFVPLLIKTYRKCSENRCCYGNTIRYQLSRNRYSGCTIEINNNIKIEIPNKVVYTCLPSSASSQYRKGLLLSVEV